MAYATIVRVPAPIQAYDATHAEVMKTAGNGQDVPGFILHVARATDEGFEIIEVWESKEQADKFNEEVVWPAMQRTGAPTDTAEPEVIVFDPRAILAAKLYNSHSV